MIPVVVALVAVLISGCSDDEDAQPPTTSPSSLTRLLMTPEERAGFPEDRARSYLLREVRETCSASGARATITASFATAHLSARDAYWEHRTRSEDTVLVVRIDSDGVVSGSLMPWLTVLCATS